jgi:hypothetical protein
MRILPVCLLLALLTSTHARAQTLFLEAEASVAFPLYNDVAVPGDGPRISLADGWTNRLAFAPRFRLSKSFTDRHEIALLAAPLRVSGYGRLRPSQTFDGVTFATDRNVDSRYRFDSYRATYRYHFRRGERLDLALGGTIKVRSASIELAQDVRSAETTDLGVVPLIAFRASIRVAPFTEIVLDGDALVAPQGRAADVLLAVEHEIREGMDVRIGARMREGGADADEVYSFAAFTYGVVGFRFVI